MMPLGETVFRGDDRAWYSDLLPGQPFATRQAAERAEYEQRISQTSEPNVFRSTDGAWYSESIQGRPFATQQAAERAAREAQVVPDGGSISSVVVSRIEPPGPGDAIRREHGIFKTHKVFVDTGEVIPTFYDLIYQGPDNKWYTTPNDVNAHPHDTQEQAIETIARGPRPPRQTLTRVVSRDYALEGYEDAKPRATSSHINGPTGGLPRPARPRIRN